MIRNGPGDGYAFGCRESQVITITAIWTGVLEQGIPGHRMKSLEQGQHFLAPHGKVFQTQCPGSAAYPDTGRTTVILAVIIFNSTTAAIRTIDPPRFLGSGFIRVVGDLGDMLQAGPFLGMDGQHDTSASSYEGYRRY